MEFLLTPVGNATGPRIGKEILVPGAGTFTSAPAAGGMPVLSAATGINITNSGFQPQVVAGSGIASTLYWVAYANNFGKPSNDQIRLGQNASGATALASGTESYTVAGTYTEQTAITGLSSGTAYQIAWVAWDGATYSNSVESGPITTTAPSLQYLIGNSTYVPGSLTAVGFITQVEVVVA